MSLVIVVLATVAIASTLVAVRATEARKRAEADLERAAQTIDEVTVAAATNENLQGYKMGSAREALLEPMLAYYQGYLEAHKDDAVPTPEMAAANFRVAGLYAKLGSMKSIKSLNMGVVCIYDMTKAGVDPETFPSLQHWAMDVAAPNEWLLLKGATFADLPKHAINLFVALQGAKNRFIDAHAAAPDAVAPRDELANLWKYTAMFLERQRRRDQALVGWSESADLLESLVRDQPANTDYQVRLAEALVAAGGLQKQEQDNEAAAKSFERAVELREKLLADSPDDEALAKDLENAKKKLAEVAADAAPAAEVAATPPAGDDDASQPAPEEPKSADEESAATAPGDDKATESDQKEADDGGSNGKDAASADKAPQETEAPAAPTADESAPDEAAAEQSSEESGAESPSDSASSDGGGTS